MLVRKNNKVDIWNDEESAKQKTWKRKSRFGFGDSVVLAAHRVAPEVPLTLEDDATAGAI